MNLLRRVVSVIVTVRWAQQSENPKNEKQRIHYEFPNQILRILQIVFISQK